MNNLEKDKLEGVQTNYHLDDETVKVSQEVWDAVKPKIEKSLKGFEIEPPNSRNRCWIGIDNGVTGSIGIVSESGQATFQSTPVRKELNYTKAKSYITRIDTVKLRELLSVAGPGSMVMIERPMVNPTRWKASVSAIRAFEATVTVLESLKLPYELTDSKEWQKALLPKGVSGDELKHASLSVGNRLFPYIESKHSDRDGLLIAQHCKLKHR